jgi:filamentous hemagglutinin
LTGAGIGLVTCRSGGGPSGGGGGASDSDTIQTGGNTISNRAAKALNKYFNKNLTSREWGRALEAMKEDEGLGNNLHGQIKRNGDVFDSGKLVGNLAHYLP